MTEWEDAPVTRAALGKPDKDAPPAMQQEWHRLARSDQDVIFLWAGAWRRRDTSFGWSWHWWHIGEDKDNRPHPAVRTPAANVERMLSPLAHEARIRIMQVMYDGPKASGELSEATALRGGNLYYHLKELIHAAYVREQNGGYDLTPLGCQMLVTVVGIADKVVKDRGEEGLLVGEMSEG